MAGPTPLHPLEQEDPSTTKKEWRVQQVGWIIIAAIVVAALLGVFGPGPLSWSSAATDDGSLVVDYPRFARKGSSISLDLAVSADRAEEGVIEIWIAHDLLDTLEIRQITPEPDSQTSTGGGVVFGFEVEAGAGLDATISATAGAMGVRETSIALPDDEPLELWQLFYP